MLHGGRRRLCRALRLLRRSVDGRHRPHDVPCRQLRISIPATRMPTRRDAHQHRAPTPPSAASAGRRAWSASSAMMDQIAYRLGLDPLDVRKAQFLRQAGPRRHALSASRSTDNLAARTGRRAGAATATIARAGPRSPPGTRRAAILKRGLALTPVKFGISFTLTPAQPGRRAGRISIADGSVAAEPWRHRDGAGAEHQGGAGRGSRSSASTWARCKITATTHRQGAEHLADRRLRGTDLNAMAARECRRRRSRTGCMPSSTRELAVRREEVALPATIGPYRQQQR